MSVFVRFQRHFVCLLLVCLTVAAYWQVHDFEFVVLDDEDYIANNPIVQDGLTWRGVVWAFTTDTLANWHPLTWLSYMLDCRLFGLNPGGHHLVNVLFHAINAVLLFLILERISGGLWQSAFVAALFALHPLHVESVAWVSERKDVLSTLFWLLTMAGYIAYVKRPGVARYLLAAVPFALGLMTKPMLVTLPCVLLLLDYWPLGRFRIAAPLPEAEAKRKKKKKAKARERRDWMILIEKLPLFALAAASSAITFAVQQRGGAVRSLDALPLIVRLGNAAVAYVRYIGKTLAPFRLAVHYPHLKSGLPSWQVVGAVLLLAGITVLVVRRTVSRAGGRKQETAGPAVSGELRFPYLAVGWFWYLGTLVPVIGVVQVGSQAIADRYTYVPLIGLFIMAAWGIPGLVARLPYHRAGLAVAGGLAVLGLSIGTAVQARHWRETETLFEHALAVTSENDVANFNMGIALKRKGRAEEAEKHFEEAVRIRPYYMKAQIYLALISYERGDYDEAVERYEEALQGSPNHPSRADAENNLGAVLFAQGKNEEAATHYYRAIQLKPNYANAHYNLAKALAATGRRGEAAAHYREALRIAPDHPYARVELSALEAQADAARPSASELPKPQSADECYRLANELAEDRRYADAADLYHEALKLDPGHIAARLNLGNALAVQGRLKEAVVQYRQVLEAQPNSVDAHINLGNALGELGELKEAVKAYSKAVKLKPNHLDACCGLGYMLAKQGKLDQAAQMYSKALVIDPGCAPAREALRNIEAHRK